MKKYGVYKFIEEREPVGAYDDGRAHWLVWYTRGRAIDALEIYSHNRENIPLMKCNLTFKKAVAIQENYGGEIIEDII